jgi:subtilisin family serine protease
MMKSRKTSTRKTSTIKTSTIIPAALLLLAMASSQADAQYASVGRGLNINVGPRISVNPSVRYSPNLNYDATVGDRVQESVRAKKKPSGSQNGKSSQSKRTTPSVVDASYVPNEVLIEIAGNPSEQQLQALSRKHGLTRVQSQNLPLLDATFYRWRISDGRSVDAVVRELSADGSIKSAQRNSIFRLQDDGKALSPAPEQYALRILHLPEAQALSLGENIRVAVIDSGIDVAHPELAGSIEASYDALGSKEGPHAHGTGIAGVIAAHGKLKGAAPAARLLAIRAFGEKKSGAESTSFLVLKSLDYAAANGARIINMSFAGPHDTAIERGLAAAAAKGILLVAAAGNGGPKSAPLYPGADRNVIAVTATDASDQLFTEANQGRYVAIAAPGVDILAPLPGGKYGVSSGTSLSAAYVSGVAALMLARNPALTADDVRLTLTQSAHDLGPAGRDDQFGAGEADALAAVSAVAAPIATASERPIPVAR